MNRQTRAWRLFYEAYELAMQEWPADRQEETLSTSAGTTRVYSRGAIDGEPVILLHGGNATAASWHAVVKLLDTRYRVVAPDIIVDPGRSRPSRDHRTAEDLVEWLCGVMDALGIDRAHLVGESNGGWLAMEMALRRPKRVRRVALVAPAAVFGPIALGFWLRLMPAALLPLPMTTRLSLWAISAGDIDFDHPCVRLLVRAVCIRRGVAARPWPRVFDAAELARVRQPILLMYGDHEVLTDPQRTIAKARQHVPNLEGLTIEGAGHGLSAEQPVRLAEQLGRFLDTELTA